MVGDLACPRGVAQHVSAELGERRAASTPGERRPVNPNGARSFHAKSPLSDDEDARRDLARVAERRLHDTRRRTADTGVESLEVGRVPRHRREHHLRDDDEPQDGQPCGDETRLPVAGAPTGPKRDRRDRAPTSASATSSLKETATTPRARTSPMSGGRRTGTRHSSGVMRDRLRMEQLPPEELQRRVQQNAPPSVAAAHGPSPRVRPSRYSGTAPSASTDDLDHVQEVRSGTEPVRRGEQHQPERPVVPEHREAAHRDEVVATREEPDGLVVDAHVEVDRPEAVLPAHDEHRERRDPHHDRERERDLGRMEAAARGRSVETVAGAPVSTARSLSCAPVHAVPPCRPGPGGDPPVG